MPQVDVLAEQVVDAVKSYVARIATELSAKLANLEERILAIPAGATGERGERGDVGEPGAKGDSGPQGEPGIDGAAGYAGLTGEKGERGADGKDGADGKSITVEDFRQMFEAEHAKWTLDFERRANDTVQRFLDKIPKPNDGKDGLGFEDLTVKHDGARSFTLEFNRGEQVKSFEFHIPSMIYCGIYKPGAFQTGDVVTFGGSLFIAKCATEKKPETDDWQLCVKRGQNGKDGERGLKGEAGPSGHNGRDLTQMGTNGERW